MGARVMKVDLWYVVEEGALDHFSGDALTELFYLFANVSQEGVAGPSAQ